MDAISGIQTLIDNHKSKLEWFKWVFNKILSSTIFMYYASSMEKQLDENGNIRKINVINWRTIDNLFTNDGITRTNDGIITTWCRDNFIENLLNHPLFIKYRDIPEFEIFNNKEYIDSFKLFFTINILPFASGSVKDDILNVLNNNELFAQDPFKKVDENFIEKINNFELEYLVEYFIMLYLYNTPSAKYNEYYMKINDIKFANNQVMRIRNDKSICDIFLNDKIIKDLYNVRNIIYFVTNTNVVPFGVSEYRATSNIMNSLSIIDF